MMEMIKKRPRWSQKIKSNGLGEREDQRVREREFEREWNNACTVLI